MLKKLLTTIAVFAMMTVIAMAQTEPIFNSGTITNKGTITVGCTVAGSSVMNDAGTIKNNTGGKIEFTGAGAVLTNDNAGSITNDGTILFETANPMFANTAGTVTNNGTIQFDGTINIAVMSGLGTAAANRLGGTVVYNAASGNQIVQGSFWYTNLTLSAAGTKTYTGGSHYYVYEDYTVSGGDRTYAGSIFHYDGDAAQTITPEGAPFAGGVNFYYNLQLEGDGTKTIYDATTVRVANIFNEIVTPTSPANSLEMGAGSLLSFAADINADVAGPILVNGGQIIMEGDGAFDVANSSSMTFQGTNPLFEMNGGDVTNAGLMEFKSGSYDQKSGNSVHAGQLTLSGGDYNQITGNVLIQGQATISDATSTYKQDAGLVMISGNMTVSAGLFDINGTNATDDLVTIAQDATLALSNVAGLIDMAAGTNMLVNGSFTNAAATPTNLTFASTSTVTYDGGTQILVTSVDNSFGNLVLKTSPKTPLADIYVGGNFSLSDADLNMNTSIATNSTLFIKTASATNVVYGTGLITDMEQVIGKMNRTIGDAAEDIALVYNNNATVITMTTLGLDDLTLNVTPGDIAYGDYKAAEDIKRSIAFDYEEGTAGWQVTMAYGYKLNELPGGAADPNFKESLLRFREVLTTTTSEKVATGSDPLRKATVGAPEEWGRVTLAGINSPTLALATVADKAELFLRGTPTTFYTISDGRWSNPGTWDEGAQPTYLDRTEILHTVHVGFEGGADYGQNAGRIDERAQSGFSGLAQEILITNEAGASLIFGNHEGGSYNSSSQIWAMNTGGIITNQNATAPTQAANLVNLDGNDLQAFVDSGTAKYQGLIIFGDTNPLSLQTNQLVNATGGNVMIGPNTTLQICDTP